jgi:uncharacterized protein DUF5681
MPDDRKVRLTPLSSVPPEYEVGYGRPPKASQFAPGRSGNPKGRPKGARNTRLGLREERGRRVDELDIDAHAVSDALNAAIQDIADLQLAPDRPHVDRLAFERKRRIAGDHDGASYAREVSREALRDPVDEMLLVGVAADIGEWQNDDREAWRAQFFRRRGRRGFRGPVDPKRVDPDRFSDVLELSLTQVGDRQIKPSLDLPIGVLRKTDRAGLANAFDPGSDIDAVAHQVAVGLLDHIAEMNADAELDAALGRKTGIAFDEAGLHLDRATHGVDHAAELDQTSIPSSLDDAPVMGVDGGIDQVGAQPRSRDSVRSPSVPASRL